MLRHILKISARNFHRNKFFAIINIAGLSLGLATFILIALYIQFEYSWDKFNNNYKRVYALQSIAHMADGDEYWSQLGYPVADAIKMEYPEVQDALVTRPVWGEYLSASEELTFYEEKGLYAQQSIFDFLTIEFIEGEPENALTEPYSIVLTRSLKDKYFKGEPAVGKYLTVNNRYDLKVTGVIDDFPENSSFDNTYISPIEILNSGNEW